MRLLLIVFLMATIISLVIARFAIDSVTLTPHEKESVAEACANCHNDGDDDQEHRNGKFNWGDDSNNSDRDVGWVHLQHGNSRCVTCHGSDRKLQDADKAHDTIQWIGIGAVTATVSLLGLNYFVTKRRLVGRECDETRQDD